MEIIKQWIVKDNMGKPQILYHTVDGKYYTSSNGAFGQRETYLTELSEYGALDLINPKNKSL